MPKLASLSGGLCEMELEASVFRLTLCELGNLLVSLLDSIRSACVYKALCTMCTAGELPGVTELPGTRCQRDAYGLVKQDQWM